LAGAADDGRGILRLEITTGELAPLTSTGAIPGDVYSHYDTSIGRRVWAIYEGQGRFGIAMGAGSAQPARRFGLAADFRDMKDAVELLRRRDPKLAEEVVREGTIVFFKLHPDQTWRLTRTSVPVVYNEESGERWELLSETYIPVGHLGGFSWRRVGDRFVPASDGCSW
jgi:hypothetical protein